MCARDQSSVFITGGKFRPDYGLLLELHALTLVARSYALLVILTVIHCNTLKIHLGYQWRRKMFSSRGAEKRKTRNNRRTEYRNNGLITGNENALNFADMPCAIGIQRGSSVTVENMNTG